jgi:hypothetical protein
LWAPARTGDRNIGYAGTGCLTVGAGASFETRDSRNTYTVVTLDLLQAQRTVQTVQYNPATTAFEFTSTSAYPIEITPAGRCGVAELAQAIKTYRAAIAPFAHYFSALLLDAKAEILIPSPNGYSFGSFAVLEAQPNTDLKRTTAAFRAFRNVLRVFYKRLPLRELLNRYGDGIERYEVLLDNLCKAQPEQKARFAEREHDAQMLAAAEPQRPFSYTVSLFEELASNQEWVLLRDQAERHAASDDRAIAIPARRMLALSLGQSDEAGDRRRAVEIYRSLVAEGVAEPRDQGNLATLLIRAECFDEATATVLDGIGRYPADARDYFVSIGLQIVETTGDRASREKLVATKATRGSCG